MISMMSIIIKATMEEKLSFIPTEPAISKSHHKLSITKCLTLCDVPNTPPKCFETPLYKGKVLGWVHHKVSDTL